MISVMLYQYVKSDEINNKNIYYGKFKSFQQITLAEYTVTQVLGIKEVLNQACLIENK